MSHESRRPMLKRSRISGMLSPPPSGTNSPLGLKLMRFVICGETRLEGRVITKKTRRQLQSDVKASSQSHYNSGVLRSPVPLTKRAGRFDRDLAGLLPFEVFPDERRS